MNVVWTAGHGYSVTYSYITQKYFTIWQNKEVKIKVTSEGHNLEEIKVYMQTKHHDSTDYHHREQI